jgi:hypothetical protein
LTCRRPGFSRASTGTGYLRLPPLFGAVTILNMGTASESNILYSVADPRCFIPDPDLTIFSSRIRIQTYSHPGAYMKSGMQNYQYSFLCFQEQSLSLIQIDLGSGNRKKFIPDPGGKKAPDPESRSVTLILIHMALILILITVWIRGVATIYLAGESLQRTI